jgi:phosphatidate cytidylyltransferase
MARRTITGTLLGVAVLASVATVPSFTLVLLLVSLASLWEFAQLSSRKGPGIVLPVAVFGVVAYILLTAFGLQHRYERPLLGATIILSVAFGLVGSRQGYLARCAFTLFGVLYIGWLGSYFIALRTLPHVGSGFAVASILLIATTDIFAMLVGTSIGRTPLSPISPRKTWEGAIGGLVASSALGAALGLVPQLGLEWWQGLLAGAITSIAAQAGDLVESALKRDAAVKDAGTLLWGHGGMLDRYDSYIFGGIAFYFAMWLTGPIPPRL